MNIHDALHRLVLRARWVKWLLREKYRRIHNGGITRSCRLSDRLHRFAPILQATTLPENFLDPSQPSG